MDKGWLKSAIESASDPRFALVDSGATNALRPAREGEIGGSRIIRVDLASGAVDLHVNEHGTLLSQTECQVIVPAGYLVRLGYDIVWKRKGCLIKRARDEVLAVEVVKGCPLIPRQKGLDILREYETRLEKGEVCMLKPSSTLDEGLELLTARSWLSGKVGTGKLSRGDQLAWLRTVFPEVPLDYLNRVAGDDVNPCEAVLEGSPWNRRLRRTILRAKRGEVLVHLFSGQQRWKCKGIVVEVEKSKGADLMHVGVWQQLLSWAVGGAIGGIIGGPPCRTVSSCRTKGDGGPPPLRGRGLERWGLPNLTGHWYETVRGDSVLWLRFLLLYAVAQASADGGSRVTMQTGVEEQVKPARSEQDGRRHFLDSAGTRRVTMSGLPKDLNTPVEVAKWALQQAAERLQTVDRIQEGCGHGTVGDLHARQPDSVFTVFFGWEHPADPQEYRRLDEQPDQGWPSWWVFPEWQWFASTYSVFEAKFDQGKLGHVRPKPTTFATTSWALYEMLHGHCLTSEERGAFGQGPTDFRQRIQEAPSWAQWAPGLTERVLIAWTQWGRENGLWEDVCVRKAWLKRLTEREAWRRHQAQDHTPFRKGCPICVAAQGRQRNHWRASVTAVYSLSVDVAGPYKPGQSWDPIASGRDKGRGYKYFLASAFTIPLEFNSVNGPEKTSPGKDAEPPEAAPHGMDLPDMRDLFGAEESDEPALVPLGGGAGASLKVVEHRFHGKRPEPEGPPLPPPADPPIDVPSKTRTLFLAVPFKDTSR